MCVVIISALVENCSSDHLSITCKLYISPLPPLVLISVSISVSVSIKVSGVILCVFTIKCMLSVLTVSVYCLVYRYILCMSLYCLTH